MTAAANDNGTPFRLGEHALAKTDQGGTAKMLVAAVTQWLNGFQPPVEYALYDGNGTLYPRPHPPLRPIRSGHERPAATARSATDPVRNSLNGITALRTPCKASDPSHPPCG